MRGKETERKKREDKEKGEGERGKVDGWVVGREKESENTGETQIIAPTHCADLE